MSYNNPLLYMIVQNYVASMLQCGRLGGYLAGMQPATATIDAPRRRTAATRLFKPLTFTKRSRQRFSRVHTAELVASLGHDPSYAERLLIDRLVASLWNQARAEAQMDDGEALSPHAAREYNATGNRIRLDLIALRLKAPAPTPKTLAQHLAEKAAARASVPPGAPAAQRPATGAAPA